MSEGRSGSEGSNADTSDEASGTTTAVAEEVAVDAITKRVPASHHPQYLNMVLDAVGAQQTRSSGVSRAKIATFIKSKYDLEEVNGTALKNAIKKGLEKEQIENKTGTNLTGTFILSKSEKAKVAREEKKNGEAAKAKQKEGTENTAKAKAKAKSSGAAKLKDDLKVESEKKVTKKTQVMKPTSKGKENAPKWKKGDPVRKPKILQEKVKQVKKSQSASAVLEPSQPSTSKQRNTKTKAPAKKE